MTRVLVIDDEPSIRQMLVYVLSDERYIVDAASDGQAALELIGAAIPTSSSWT